MKKIADTDCGEIDTSNKGPWASRSSGEIKLEGVDAFRRGEADSVCPYPSGGATSQARSWWMHGFIAAQTVESCRSVTLSEMLR